jgi:hypothetical protein
MIQDLLSPTRAAADAAAKELDDGHLVALEKRLAANRGNADFAHFFTARATPRSLGDALASVAGTDRAHPLRKGVDAHAYELTLTDLAGTLALATHGTGDRALPKSWTANFVKATTAPKSLYGNDTDSSGKAGRQRADQDVANQQNLLLVLSRGFWSFDLLASVTNAYWDLDHKHHGHAWPAKRMDGAKYAPAPNGTYLTDGMLALTAALTANPPAAEWAFTDFRPGTKKVDGGDDAVGRFTYYLIFEHQFPTVPDGDHKGDNIGMTATLTALSSAVRASPTDFDPSDTSDSGRPKADAAVLQRMAKDATDGGSFLSKAWDAAKRLAVWVWHAVQSWGHPILFALSLAPIPFGLAAAGANGAWYVIDGDYLSAGLSILAVIPTLAFAKVAKEGEAAVAEEAAAEDVASRGAAAAAERASEFGKDAKGVDEIATAANAARAGAEAEDNTAIVTAETVTRRPPLSNATKDKVLAQARTDAQGDFIDPNTGQTIPREGPYHFGHKPGFEWRCTKQKAIAAGWTMKKLYDYFDDPNHLQIEDPASNLSHRYEAMSCPA